MRCSPFAFACFVLPSGVIAACFLLSTHLEQIPVCFPFFSGCTSISAAARQEPAIHLFRVVMLPLTTVLAGFWVVSRVWLLRMGAPSRDAATVCWLGVTGSVFLVLYVVFLGTHGQIYAYLRRFGTTIYFGGTGLAQLMLAAQLQKLRPQPIAKGMLWISTVMLIMGIIYIPAAHAFSAANVENIIEWNFALLMHVNFGLVSILWRRDALHLTVTP